MKRKLLFSVFVVFAFAFTTKDGSHANWDSLLKKHVNSNGYVNYKSFKADKAQLQKYLTHLSTNAPQASWSKADKMAFWINAYNAFTVKAILDYYPVDKITNIKPKSGAETVWKDKFFSIGGQKRSLDEIENQILRKDFNDPRIHFAINCASESCPKLLNKAVTGANLESTLESLAKGFINDSKRNKITPSAPQLSSIFDWFKADFTKNGTVIDYINKYSTVKVNKDAKISYLTYDWSLNEQK